MIVNILIGLGAFAVLAFLLWLKNTYFFEKIFSSIDFESLSNSIRNRKLPVTTLVRLLVMLKSKKPELTFEFSAADVPKNLRQINPERQRLYHFKVYPSDDPKRGHIGLIFPIGFDLDLTEYLVINPHILFRHLTEITHLLEIYFPEKDVNEALKFISADDIDAEQGTQVLSGSIRI